uniref:Ras-GEF domain-containing protein n=1 Tax=Stomoxys calcitrans TaxID=35570 RepID=A0A1I8Q971_STOCA
MAMYYYASKISAIACGTRCRQSVLQKSRGQRDRDKQHHHQQRQRLRHCGQESCHGSPTCSSGAGCDDNNGGGGGKRSRTPGDCTTDTDDEVDDTGGGICIRMHKRNDNHEYGSGSGRIYVTNTNDTGTAETSVSTLVAADGAGTVANTMDGVRYRRRFSEQLDAYDIELGFQKFEVSSTNTTKNSINGYGITSGTELVQYDVPRNTFKRSQCDVNFESSVLGSGGIMYINGRIVSGPLESLVDVLVPKNIIDLDKKKWDQPSSSGGPPGAQDPKKTCNLETYLDWSARLRLFVCNEILQCGGIHDRSKCVELWSGVAQYCLLVGNYNSATAILETLESPPIARLKITWSKLQVTCQQLDCMQRHAEGHGNLWHKQAIVLNESHHYQNQLQQQQRQHQHLQQKTDTYFTSALSSSATATGTVATATAIVTNPAILSTSSSAATTVTALTDTTTTTATTADVEVEVEAETSSAVLSAVSHDGSTTAPPSSSGSSLIKTPIASSEVTLLTTPTDEASQQLPLTPQPHQVCSTKKPLSGKISNSSAASHLTTTTAVAFNSQLSANTSDPAPSTSLASSSAIALPTVSNTLSSKAVQPAKPNDWVVIPVFADIVKLALAGREDCLQR